jgi:anaerobic ribonucleoside-triphosphate reductase activating protein
MLSASDPIVRVAMVVPRTEAEGPGARFALWVQGCPFRCPGCCNPEMLSFHPRSFVSERSASALVAECLATDGEGVSLLGGEPFAQAEGLAAVARGVRAAGRSVMVFSGYTLDELRAMTSPAVAELLAHTDLLVDGRYDETRRTTQRRWVGSDNQVMHFLSDRYDPLDPRFHEGNHLEIRMRDGEITLNGWPVLGSLTRLGPRR